MELYHGAGGQHLDWTCASEKSFWQWQRMENLKKKRLRNWLEIIEKSVSMEGDENLDDDTVILVIVSLQNYKLIEGGEMA